jgi:anthranilate synthase component 2
MDKGDLKIILIDNYDSFTFNLVHLLEKVTGNLPVVKRNDEISLEEIVHYDLIVLSPGPGIPREAGLLIDIIKKYAHSKPIFGVCLGLQALVEVFGGELENMETVYHGVATEIEVLDKESKIFKGMKSTLNVGRYHSWVASRNHFPKEFKITAIGQEQRIMAIEHITLPIFAVQFHPESILTPTGELMLKNVIEAI